MLRAYLITELTVFAVALIAAFAISLRIGAWRSPRRGWRG